MFRCLRYLCRAISSCSGCEYLHASRSSANSTEQRHNSAHMEVPCSPAVPLRDLLNGDAYLVAQVSPSIHHSIRAPPQHHPVPILIVVVLVLKHTRSSCYVFTPQLYSTLSSDRSGDRKTIGPQHLLSPIINNDNIKKNNYILLKRRNTDLLPCSECCASHLQRVSVPLSLQLHRIS